MESRREREMLGAIGMQWAQKDGGGRIVSGLWVFDIEHGIVP